MTTRQHILMFSFIALHVGDWAQAQSISPEVPQWAKGAVWYQIFPERFRNGDAENDPVAARTLSYPVSGWQVHSWTANWFQMQEWEKTSGKQFYDLVRERRYGGDLIGVIEKLDYLQELGVDVIYFNPVFEARSMHKYDGSTFHHIDNNFGANRDGDWDTIWQETEDPATWRWTSADSVFLKLIKEAHQRNMRIVIDGVFNHCGREFWAFQDIVQKQRNSRYSAWFDIISWDDPQTPENEFDYKGWWGYKGLPEFKEDDNGPVGPVKEYIFNITRRWMDPNGDGDPRDGIDGWRLDVAKDVSPKFWEAWNAYAKSLNPNAITIGEIWEEAGEWIRRKRFDGVMNYPFAFAVVDFFVDRKDKILPSEFDRQLTELRNKYPKDTNHILQNLVGSHDTDRIASMLRNPDRQYDRKAGNEKNPDYDPRKPDKTLLQRQKLIVVFQFTYLGAPMIYYGDEAGMWGGDDPDDRMPMLWDDLTYRPLSYTLIRPDLYEVESVGVNHDLLAFYRRLSRIRRENPAIKKGDYQTLLVDDEKYVFAFARSLGDAHIIVVLNNSGQPTQIEIPAAGSKAGTDLLSGRTLEAKENAISLSLPPYGATIYKPN